VCFVVAFAFAGSSPDTQGSDEKITSYYAVHSHQVNNIVALLVFTVGVLFLIVFFGVLRERLAGTAGSIAFGAGIASAVLFLAAVIFFTGPALTSSDTSRFHLDPSTYRLIADMGYEFWVGAVMTGGVVAFATSAAAWATLPRWVAVTGIVAGVVMLFAVFFFPAFLYWLWIAVASIVVARSGRVSAAPVVAQPA
jgi:hypothetical protein